MWRDIAELSSYNMTMLAAKPCNHAFYLMAHCDIFWHELNIWQQKQQQGNTTALAPILLSFAQHAADKSVYASSYVSKPDMNYANDKLINIAHCLNEIQ